DAPHAPHQLDVEYDRYVQKERIATVNADDVEIEPIHANLFADLLFELVGDGAADEGVKRPPVGFVENSPFLESFAVDPEAEFVRLFQVRREEEPRRADAWFTLDDMGPCPDLGMDDVHSLQLADLGAPRSGNSREEGNRRARLHYRQTRNFPERRRNRRFNSV